MTDQPNLFDDIKPKTKGNRENAIALSKAMAEAMNIDLEHSTSDGLTRLFVAAVNIDKAGGKPEDVAGVLSRARSANKTYKTPSALASHWGEFYRVEQYNTVQTRQPDPYDYRSIQEQESQANIARAKRVALLDQAEYLRIRKQVIEGATVFARQRAERVESFLNMLICEALDAEEGG